MSIEAMKATPHKQLIDELMDSRIPKTEREHAAAREIERLRQAIAEAEKQEPVAMRYDFDGYGYKYIDNGSGSDWQTRIKDAEPVFAHPQRKREWQGLTEDEAIELLPAGDWEIESTLYFAKMIEAKLREKNGC